jgi:hypothetical protein
MKWTTEQDEYLKQNFVKSPIEEIKQKLNRNWPTISWRCRKLGLKDVNSYYLRKYSLNTMYFSTPTIQNSYWAGFIAADGCTIKNKQKLEILIKSTDKNILENFKKDIKFSGPIRDRTINNSKLCRIIIKSKQIIDDLYNNFNITPKKSLTLLPPSSLNLIQSLAFIRGFIDGDGSIIYTTGKKLCIHFNGTEKMLKWIISIFNQINPNMIGKQKISKNKSIYRWSLSGKFAIYFFNILSKLDTYNLYRKWNKKEKRKIYNLNEFIKGWICGAFIPSLFISDKFEIAIKRYKAGDHDQSHIHKVADEITMIIDGFVDMNGIKYHSDDIILIERGETTDFTAITDATTCVIKIPCVKGDKYLV